MKKLTLIFVLTTGVLALACLWQWQKASNQKTQLTSLKTVAEQKARELEAAETAERHAQQQRLELAQKAEEQAAELQKAKQLAKAQAIALRSGSPPPSIIAAAASSPKPEIDKAGFGKFLSKMMQDPEAKKFIREQQRLMIDQLYAPLSKQLGLTHEESDKLKGLLTDNMMKNAEKGSSLFDGSASTNRAEMFSALAEEQKSFDQSLKDLLGDDRFGQFKDYQLTVGDRTVLNQFKQQMSSGENPLNDQQTEQLLAIIKEEKKNVAASTGQDLAANNQDPAKFQAMFSGEQTDKMLQTQELINQQVYQRAGQVLLPEQMDAFGKFQTNQLQMLRMSMSMAKKFFVPDQPDAVVTKPN